MVQLGAEEGDPDKYILKFEGDSDIWLTIILVIVLLIVLCCCVCICCCCCECCPWNKAIREKMQQDRENQAAFIGALTAASKKEEEKKEEKKEEGKDEEKKDE